tara:strand:- start:143 stop:1543 length:1401 start_codon:yes stop_codon:yes gene_type:complete
MQITTVIDRSINQLFNQKKNISPLIIFRIIFGLMMFASTLRFILKGWVEEFYINPVFYFNYLGFEWVKPLNSEGMWILFYLLLISTVFIAFGFLYRISIISYFLIFTYIELIDKTYYLNHYYFISVLSFILIFLPLHRSFSLDSYLGICKRVNYVKSWTINCIKLQIGMVYFFAGIAKLNYHWLFEAQPMINWLKHQSDFPIFGKFLLKDYTAYLFSWVGALFDLSIFFILINKRCRIFGYILVVIFHVMTSIMFPIGVFPLVMICSTLIFFSENFHSKVIYFISKLTLKSKAKVTDSIYSLNKIGKPLIQTLLISFFVLQLLLPFRYLLYPGKLFWTEQGYRFSWRVMLIEKSGYAQFYIHEPLKDRKKLIENKDYLTPQQEKMMSTQPDMILQFAQHISSIYKDSVLISNSGKEIKFGNIPKVTADVKVCLFNTGSRDFVKKGTNLSLEKRGFYNKDWIIPYEK